MAVRNVISVLGMVLIAFIIAPNDPQILAAFEWDIEKAKRYLNSKREETGLPLTLAHVVGYCAARALRNEPDFNGRICFGNVKVSNSPLVLS